jgi:hypothetical protein
MLVCTLRLGLFVDALWALSPFGLDEVVVRLHNAAFGVARQA